MLSHGLHFDRCACDVEGRGMHEIYIHGLTVASVAAFSKEWRRKDTLNVVEESSDNTIAPKSARLLGMIR